MARNPIDFEKFWGDLQNREWAKETVLKGTSSLDSDDADDVVQEAMIRLWTGGHARFDPNKNPLPDPEDAYRSWVRKYLQGSAANLLERRRRRAGLQEQWTGQPSRSNGRVRAPARREGS